MWKSIPNWEWYQVNENGEVKNTETGKILNGDINNAGYHRVCLYRKPNKQRFFIHRLVAELFIPNPNNYNEVNHIDGNKNNNHISNLEWSTRTHNEHECRRLNLKDYKPYEVVWSNGSKSQYEFTPELADELGVTRRTVLNYLQGKSQGYKQRGIQKIYYL